MSFSTVTGTRLDVLAYELQAALAERKLFVGRDAPSMSVAAGTNIQAYSFWAAAQADAGTISNAGDKVVNHVDGPMVADNSGVLYFTTDALQDAAGLTEAGAFRRKVSVGDAFSYGYMQEGDIIGPWIIEDLQAVISARQWFATEFDTSSSIEWIDATGYGGRGGSGGGYDTCAFHYNEALASWIADSWDGVLCDRVAAAVGGGSTYGGGYEFFSGRMRTRIFVAAHASSVAQTVDLYARASNSPGTFSDIDGMGLVDNEFANIETFSFGAGAAGYSNFLGGTSDPLPLSGVGCPISTYMGVGWGISLGKNVTIIRKPSFVYG